MRKSKTIYALLGWLSMQPHSGYDLKNLTERYVGEFWYGSFGQIYPLLHQMLDVGLVSVHEERSEKHPPRKVYAITDRGRAEFDRWMHSRPENDLFRSELLLRLFFGHLSDPDVLHGHIAETLQGVKQRLTHFEAIRKKVEADYAESPLLPYMLITLDRGVTVNKGYVEWAQRTLKTLQTIKAPVKKENDDR